MRCYRNGSGITGGGQGWPLLPALRAATVSPRERENRPPLRGGSNALGRAGVSALNRGALSASVVELLGSSQAHWCCERCFPLTPALSLGERENRAPRFRQSGAPRLVAARDAVFPLPAGEGQGEGERDAPTETAGRILQGQFDRLPDSELIITSSAKPLDGGSASGRKDR